MSMAEKIVYVHEPNDLQCGQAVLAMITGTDVRSVCLHLGNERETTLAEMQAYLAASYITLVMPRREATGLDGLPPAALLSLETPRCWHWSLYVNGTFYDPEHGVMTDFTECRRKFYWEVRNSEEEQ